MEFLQVKNLSFTYPNRKEAALDGLNFSVERGSFTVLCGQSGSGKTTLLRLLKRELAPHGTLSGEILYGGAPLSTLSDRRSAAEIGFVRQDPDEQLVTDKVWHELAFGLESLGLKNSDIHRRVGEMASYFGIQSWYHSETDRLSGGQKQLLNLASVMVMQPKLLLLDEPTSQLDPIAAADFIATLQKLNRELGLTILLSEHRLEEVFPVADRVIVMERGRPCLTGTPRELCGVLRSHPLAQGLPSASRIWAGLDVPDTPCPLTVREGRELLETYFAGRAGALVPVRPRPETPPVLQADGLCFRYEKDAPDVLRELSLSVHGGEIFALLGGNGAGKTTTLHLLAGLEKPYRGTIRILGKKMKDYKNGALYRGCLSLLPQSPRTVFLKDTVREDYRQLLEAHGVKAGEQAEKIDAMAARLDIAPLLDRHPYDLSGGEQQKCALGKLLLTDPKILLLDEPTKGLDAEYKERLRTLLHALRTEGRTIVLVTHDVEFAAAVADRCALFFDGEVIADGAPNEFFSGNHFYTTAASRIARAVFPNAVLCEEVVALCREATP